MKRIPPLPSFLAFEAAARLGTISKAADELALSQSTVSQQILNLEEWVGQSLFTRMGRGVLLTAAGVLFRQTVDDMLHVINTGRNRIEPYKNINSVLICCPSTFAKGWLMDQLVELKQDFPDLEIWVITLLEMRTFDKIDVDLIFSNRLIDDHDVAVQLFVNDEKVAVCGNKTFRKIRYIPFPKVVECAPLIFNESSPDWAPWLPGINQSGLKVVRGPTFDDDDLVIDAAVNEMGIAIVSKLHAEHELKNGNLQLLPHIPKGDVTQLWLMKPRTAPRTAVADLVFDWLAHRRPTS